MTQFVFRNNEKRIIVKVNGGMKEAMKALQSLKGANSSCWTLEIAYNEKVKLPYPMAN